MRRRWWLAGATVLAATAAGYRAAWRPEDGPGEAEARAAAYAAHIGLALPAGTRAEFAVWMTGIDAAARLVLVMPEAGWAVLRAALLPGPFEQAGNVHLGADEDGWRPGDAPGLTAAQLPWRGGAEVLNLGFAPAGPGQVRVYVFWFQL